MITKLNLKKKISKSYGHFINNNIEMSKQKAMHKHIQND